MEPSRPEGSLSHFVIGASHFSFAYFTLLPSEYGRIRLHERPGELGRERTSAPTSASHAAQWKASLSARGPSSPIRSSRATPERAIRRSEQSRGFLPRKEWLIQFSRNFTVTERCM